MQLLREDYATECNFFIELEAGSNSSSAAKVKFSYYQSISWATEFIMAKVCLDLEFRGPFHKLFALAQASSTMLSFFGVTSLYGLKIYWHMHNARVWSFSEMELYVYKLLLGDFSICLLHLILTAPCFLFWFSVLRTFGFQLFSISGGSQWHKLDFSQLLGIATESCSWGWAGSVKYCKFWLNKALLIQGESCSGWPLGVIENGQLGTNYAITDLKVS